MNPVMPNRDAPNHVAIHGETGTWNTMPSTVFTNVENLQARARATK